MNRNYLSVQHEEPEESVMDSFFDDEGLDSSASRIEWERKQEVRNRPVEDSKFLLKWKRIRAKLKVSMLWKGLGADIQMFGTSINLAADDQAMQEKLIRMSRNKDRKEGVMEENLPFCMFHPNRGPKTVWNIVLMTLLIYTATVMPYKIAFIESEPGDGWFYLEIVLDLLFFVDVIVNIFSAYYDNESQLVTNRTQIFFAYLRGWLVLDVLACFPFDMVAGGNSNGNLIRLVRLPRLQRLMRMGRIIKMMSNNGNECMENFQDWLNSKGGLIRLFKTFATVLMFMHIISCMWYFMAKLDGFGPDSWVVRMGYENDEPGDLYIASFYWSLTTLTTVGYGDITAKTLYERILAMIWMTFSMVFLSFTIGNLASMIGGDKQGQILNEKLLVIDEFCKEARIPRQIKSRLKRSLRYTTEKTGFNWADKRDIFDELPRVLKYEVCLCMHQGGIKKIPFFMDKDYVFFTTIVPFLQPGFYGSEEKIFVEGDYADEMYFIINGRVNYVYGEQDIPYKALQSGSYFGEIELIDNVPRKNSIAAALDCDMFVMNKALFGQVRNDFPVIFNEMKEISDMRDKVNSKARSELEKLATKGPPGEVKESEEKEGEDKVSKEPEVEDSPEKPKSKPITDEKLLRLVETNEASVVFLQHNLEDLMVMTDDILEMQKRERPVKRLSLSQQTPPSPEKDSVK